MHILFFIYITWLITSDICVMDLIDYIWYLCNGSGCNASGHAETRKFCFNATLNSLAGYTI